jgi:hypothetical protein
VTKLLVGALIGGVTVFVAGCCWLVWFFRDLWR